MFPFNSWNENRREQSIYCVTHIRVGAVLQVSIETDVDGERYLLNVLIVIVVLLDYVCL